MPRHRWMTLGPSDRIVGVICLLALCGVLTVGAVVATRGSVKGNPPREVPGTIGERYDSNAPYHTRVDPSIRDEVLFGLEDHKSWCDFSTEDESDPEGSVDPRGRQSGGISCVDWKNIAVPGTVCGVEREVPLKDGEATVLSTKYRGAGLEPPLDAVRISVSVTGYDGGVVYGDLDNDGFDEAAVSVWCDNRGGTAAGQIGQEWVIFTDASKPRVIASISPVHGKDSDFHISYFGSSIFMAPGLVVAEELWYGEFDATCCPTGRAIITWSFANGKLSLRDTRVVSEPSQEPGC